MTTLIEQHPSWKRGIARWRGIATSICAIALLAHAAAAAGRTSARHAKATGDDFEWHGHVAAGKAIEIKGVNGAIVAEATTGDDVEVVARKSARRSDSDDVQIEVIEHEDGITLCAVYPTPRGDLPNQCQPGAGGRMNTRDNDVEVAFTVRVPARVRFVGRTVNGSIEAHGLGADAEAHTVNGSVGLSTRGTAEASTVNGSIDVEMKTAPREALEFTTVNGGISLVVPAAFGAEIRASTVNGDIRSEFPITVLGKISRGGVKGTIGSGGPKLMMNTVNGDIRLRSAS